ncbi:hypothetical protein ACFQZZ_22255 [Nocardia sp. GCM10030253]|uniref:hypothetical protein n=1 Tax=Nocardia sp. GCM10030253 TaxID=3273404 RepID=UPI00362B4EC6
MTEEEGTVSGDLDVTVDQTGKGLVRYRGTDSWYTIGNLEAEVPRTWATVADLAAAIEAGIGRRDVAGNVMPFEAVSAGAESDQPADGRGDQLADSESDQPAGSRSDQSGDIQSDQKQPGHSDPSAVGDTGRKNAMTADLDDQP